MKKYMIAVVIIIALIASFQFHAKAQNNRFVATAASNIGYGQLVVVQDRGVIDSYSGNGVNGDVGTPLYHCLYIYGNAATLAIHDAPLRACNNY